MPEELASSAAGGSSAVAPQQLEWCTALQHYFRAIEFEPGIQLLHQSHISEQAAFRIGVELVELRSVLVVREDRFDETAERLYRCSETIKFTMAIAYSLVSRALGFDSYVAARLALQQGKGVLSPSTALRGASELLVFALKSSR